MAPVTLRCALFGEATLFSVDIDLREGFSTLRKVIAEVLSVEREVVLPRLVNLYLAREHGTWLKHDRSVVSPLQGAVPDEFVKMDMSSALNEEECFGEAFEPEADEIHVLVQVMKQKRISAAEWSELGALLFRHVLIDSLTVTPRGDHRFKTELRTAYDCNQGGRLLRCMLLDVALPNNTVVATHLLRRCNAQYCKQMAGFSNIDDVRNGLLLFEPLKHVFDQFQISFIYKGSTDAFCLQIFDPSVRPLRLIECLDNTKRKRMPRNFDAGTTFEDLEGRALCFRSEERPFRHILNLQARLARKIAVEKQWIQPDEGDFEDYWRESMSWAKHTTFSRGPRQQVPVDRSLAADVVHIRTLGKARDQSIRLVVRPLRKATSIMAVETRELAQSPIYQFAMETFLLEQAPHVPFLLPLFERRELESLSSCSRRLATSLLRDVFFQHSLVVVPGAPQCQHVVSGILAGLSTLTLHVAISNPRHLASLRRLPLLSTIRLAKPKPNEPDEHEDNTEPISLAYEDVIALWHLSLVVHLELDAWVEDIVVLFRDMSRLESLDLVFRYHIGSIELLAHLQHLRSLRVSGEILDDVSAVGALTNLVSLELSSWGVHDISALRALERLECLDLSRCNVADLTPIAELTYLRCLKLEETPVEDLSPLSGLISLEFLSLARSGVSDLTPLSARALSLHYLDLSGCTLTQVDALRALSRLECLRLHKTTWSTIGTEPNVSAVLASLPSLRIVDGRLNALLSLHPEGVHTRLELVCLQRMRSLETLELTSDSLSGNTVPITLPHLVSLSIEWNYTYELDVPLAAVAHPRLRALQLMRLRLRRLGNLKHAPQLQELRLVDVYLEDLSMLRVATNLTHLEHTCAMVHYHVLEGDEQPHDKAPTDDLEALESLTKLQHLDLSYTSIRSLQPLQHLPDLRFIDLSSTDITDLSSLVLLKKLECIRLRETEIRRFDGGAFCRVLRELALPEHVDCRTIRAQALMLKKLLHPDRDCLWTNHLGGEKAKRQKREGDTDRWAGNGEPRLQCAQS